MKTIKLPDGRTVTLPQAVAALVEHIERSGSSDRDTLELAMRVRVLAVAEGWYPQGGS